MGITALWLTAKIAGNKKGGIIIARCRLLLQLYRLPKI